MLISERLRRVTGSLRQLTAIGGPRWASLESTGPGVDAESRTNKYSHLCGHQETQRGDGAADGSAWSQSAVGKQHQDGGWFAQLAVRQDRRHDGTLAGGWQ